TTDTLTTTDTLNDTQYTQPALFAIEVALFRLAQSWGIHPDFLAGHSIGELTAAHLAGVWTLPDAARLVAARGRLMQALPPGGAMLAVQATEHDIRPLLTPQTDIAAVNTPHSLVLSGPENALAHIADTLTRQGHKTKKLTVSHAFHSPLMDPILDEFHQIAQSLTYHHPHTTVISHLTGTTATPQELTSPDYWTHHLRATVRFADGITTLHEQGTTTFLELGPDGVLTALGQETAPGNSLFVPFQRRDLHEVRAAVSAVGRLHAAGVPADLAALTPGGSRVDLPTYAFQHEWYWPDSWGGARDANSLGLNGTGHPLLGAVARLPESGGVLATGLLSVRSHPWLADHTVAGTTVVPGAALVEMVVRAGDEAGTGAVEDLVIEAPLVLPKAGGVRVQVSVSARDELGRRPVTVHSAAQDAEADAPWTRHVTGYLTDRAPGAGFDLAQWPPAQAEQLDLDGFYDRQLDAGYAYGPAFQGVRSVWTKGGEVYAEVALPEGQTAEGFGIHPALLDAALQTTGLLSAADDSASGTTRLPFAWNDVVLYASGATALRVRATRTDQDGLTLEIADHTGAPVAAIGTLTMREVRAEQLGAEGAPVHDHLYRVAWTPVTVPGRGEAAVAGFFEVADGPAVTALAEAAPAWGLLGLSDTPDTPDSADGPRQGADRAKELTARTLDVIQTWLAEPRLDDSRLAVVTRGAVREVTDPAARAAWGLVRTAQTENPGRIVLVDLDEASVDLLPAALACGEAQLALRDGDAFAPRLARVTETAGQPDRSFDPEGTVLVTGGLGTLGRLVARHLATEHGVRH
ncbi:acyltransferase domain-containing protein, partial [Streptomyces olivaceus]